MKKTYLIAAFFVVEAQSVEEAEDKASEIALASNKDQHHTRLFLDEEKPTLVQTTDESLEMHTYPQPPDYDGQFAEASS